jgi:hypothetical protein
VGEVAAKQRVRGAFGCGVLVFTPHPPLRVDLSHKGRGKKTGFSRGAFFILDITV